VPLHTVRQWYAIVLIYILNRIKDELIPVLSWTLYSLFTLYR